MTLLDMIIVRPSFIVMAPRDEPMTDDQYCDITPLVVDKLGDLYSHLSIYCCRHILSILDRTTWALVMRLNPNMEYGEPIEAFHLKAYGDEETLTLLRLSI